MAYTTVDENTFYVHGGRANPELHGGIGEVKSQFFSLDLTRSWKTSDAPWTALSYSDDFAAQSPPTGHSMTASQDGQTLTFWMTGPTLIIGLDFSERSWIYYQSKFNIPDNKYNLHAARDPTTGLVYIPGAGASDNWNNILEVNTDTQRINSTSLPA
ncbi:hypothetical protein BGZ95_006493, partial [Linnemannia exigua]